MFASIWNDIKRQVSYGNMLTRIIIVNIGFWVVMIFAKLFLHGFGLYEPILHSLSLSTDWKHMLLNPWSLITYMFLHEGVFHILFNMLILYWFGRIFGDFLGDPKVLPLYIMGGLAGFVFYFFGMFLFFPGVSSFCYGASASVMAFVSATATLVPNHEMRLILIGPVKIKFIALALILIDFAAIANNSNTGGHIAHLGGVTMGIIYIILLNRGDDLAAPFNQFFGWVESLFKPQPKPEPRRTAKIKTLTPTKRFFSQKGGAQTDYDGMSHQEKLDAILDKIKKQGYNKLSDEEKEFLVEASKK